LDDPRSDSGEPWNGQSGRRAWFRRSFHYLFPFSFAEHDAALTAWSVGWGEAQEGGKIYRISRSGGLDFLAMAWKHRTLHP